MDAAKRLGALNFVGNEEYTAGLGGGEYFGSHGVKNVLCVNTLPGATNTEARCKGIADGIAKSGGKSSQLPLPSSSFGNPTAVAQAIKAALLKDTTVDGAVTISAGDANSAANAIGQAGVGDKVQLASFDMDETGLDRIKDGSQLFVIDQQPYLQGYIAVSLLNGFVNYGLDLPTKPILTGPGIVNKDNVDTTIAGAQAGAR
jgi:simple sugar transport system substrate-binding protein